MPKDAPRPVHLPDDVWHHPDILDLCRVLDADGLFRLARKYGFTNESIGYWTGIDPGEISKRINGGKGPVRAIEGWGRIADGLNMPAHARHAIGLAAPAGTEVEPARPAASDASPAITERDILITAQESARFGAWAESANAGTFSVDQLLSELRSLSLLYITGSSVPVFLGARAVRDRAQELLRAHLTPRCSRDLHAIAGYACTMLAWISGDLGRSTAADTHGRTAWLCADLADSPELRAWVLATRSKTAFWDRRLDDAVEFARAGEQLGAGSSVTVLLAAQQADAAAVMGRADDVRSALRRAAGHQERAGTPDAIGGLLACNSARLSNYAAAAYLRIGELDHALREADQALAEYRVGVQRAYGTELQIHVSRALGQVLRGGLDEAAEALRPVLAAPSEKRPATVAARLVELTGALRDPRYAGSREAGTMREAVRMFRAESAAPVVPPDP